MTHASAQSDKAKLTEIHSGTAAILQEGSKCMCQVATSSAHSRSSLVAAASLSSTRQADQWSFDADTPNAPPAGARIFSFSSTWANELK